LHADQYLTMSDRIQRKNLEKSKEGNTKAGSNAAANVFRNPDRYGSGEKKEEIKERIEK
jgi:hypothetical protein